MGRHPEGDRAMTAQERKQRWRDKRRKRLWPDDDEHLAELRAWESTAFDPPPKPTAKIISLKPRGRV